MKRYYIVTHKFLIAEIKNSWALIHNIVLCISKISYFYTRFPLSFPTFNKKKSLLECQIIFLRAFGVGQWIFTCKLTNCYSKSINHTYLKFLANIYFITFYTYMIKPSKYFFSFLVIYRHFKLKFFFSFLFYNVNKMLFVGWKCLNWKFDSEFLISCNNSSWEILKIHWPLAWFFLRIYNVKMLRKFINKSWKFANYFAVKNL